MKKIIIQHIQICFLFLTLISSCNKDEIITPMPDRFQVSDSKSSIKGNLVEGTALGNNSFGLAYINASPNTSATVSAEAVNGVYIDPTTVQMTGTSTVDVPLKGKPTVEGTFILTVKINIAGTTYVCSKEFYVDLPNITAINFNISENSVFNVNAPTSLLFDIYPRTTVLNVVAPANATVEIINTSPTGRTLKITPNAQFTGGDVKITASFMALPSVIKTIKFTAFANGEGTVAAPYEIPDAERLSRITYGLSNAYLLTADITQTAPGTQSSIFSGVLDGNGKKISNVSINAGTTDQVGFFSEIGAGGLVKNLTFDNLSIIGQDYSGGIAGVNRGTISNVTLKGSITGRTYVGGVAGNNFGTISNSDVTELNVSGTNNIASLAPFVNSGSVQADNVLLTVPTTFPVNVYGISSTKTVDFAFTPADGIIAVKTVPANLTATAVSGQQKVTLTPISGFISGDVQLSLQKNKLSALRNVKIYSKLEGSLFDGGDGSVANPYLISTAEALEFVKNDSSKSYKVIANIALTRTWIPIVAFSGVLDGQGFSISNLTINSIAANEGFVSTNTGTIKNLRFLEVNCTASAAFGIIAGKNAGGIIQNIAIGGNLTSTNTGDVLGGIAGELSAGGKITQCYTKMTIIASCGMVGGIVGRLTTAIGSVAEISGCTTTGTLEINASKNRIGGILGRAEGTVVAGGSVKNCLSSLVITSTGASAANVNGVGGIFGADQNAGIVPIDQCIFTGKISVGFSVGGIVGVGSTVTNCILIGDGALQSQPTLRSIGAPQTGNVGGIAGTGKVKIVNCIVKNATLKAATTTVSLPVAGISSTYQNGGYSSGNYVANASLEGPIAIPNNEYLFRIAGTAGNSPGVNALNYAGPGVTASLRTVAFDNDASSLDGATTSSTSQSFFQSTLGFDYSIWKQDADGYPTLRSAGYTGTFTLP